MTTVDLLLEEHRLIERMLNVLEGAAARLERGAPVPPAMLAEMLDVLQSYADAGHHAKEEGLFFPALARHGLDPQDSMLGAFTAQHDLGRALMTAMRDALPSDGRGDDDCWRTFAAAAREYIGLLREHIRLEDHLFVVYALELLSAEEDAELRTRMDALDGARAAAATARIQRLLADYEEALLP